jgi:hypothetical protein
VRVLVGEGSGVMPTVSHGLRFLAGLELIAWDLVDKGDGPNDALHVRHGQAPETAATLV